MGGNYVNPANAVTATRLLSLIPFWYFAHHGQRQWAFLVLVIGGLMDVLDGKIARWFDCKTPFGELFDAVADGLLYGACLVVVSCYGWAPWWAVLALFGLGVVNAIGRAIYVRRIGRTTNYRSWAMEQFVANTAFLIGFAVADYEVEYFYSAAVVTMAVIVAHDVKRMVFDPVPA